MLRFWFIFTAPLEVNAPQPTYKTLTGETITLQCVVTSGTATQIRWFKNNQLLNLGANSRLSGATPTNPSLTIAGVVMSDADNYICQATDGSTTKNTTVINVTVRCMFLVSVFARIMQIVKYLI